MPLLPGALFKGQDASPWFPAPGGSMDRARAACRACPARVRCLEWAMQADERAGSGAVPARTSATSSAAPGKGGGYESTGRGLR